MAIRGNKGKPPYLKLVTGNPGRRPIRVNPYIEDREGPLKPPHRLAKPQASLWRRCIDSAHWLTDQDAPLAYAWVCLQAQHDDAPDEMGAAKLCQLRLLASELGLNPSSRARMGVSTKREHDPTDEFFK